MFKTNMKAVGYIISAVFLIFLPCAYCWGIGDNQSNDYNKTLPSIMTLEVETKSGSTFNATAFLAIKNGIAVTAWQAVKNARQITAIFPNGEEFESSGLVDKDVKRNLALIKIKVFGRPMLTCDPQEPKAGSKVYFWEKKDTGFNISETTINKIKVSKGIKFYYLSSLLPHESSGGPLLNSNGKVIGILGLVKGQNGPDIIIALPSAYALGLDTTLPTKDWKLLNTKPISQNDVLDKQLAEALVQLHDHLSIMVWSSFRTYGQGYRQGVPEPVYTHMEKLKHMFLVLSSSHPADTVRAQLLQYIKYALKSYLQATELYIKSVVIAQSSPQGWGARSNDLFNRSNALLNNFSPQENGTFLANLKQLTESSAIFKNTLPLGVQYWLGAVKRPAGFTLGIENYARNQFYMLVVYSSSIADKIGIRAGDTIISLDNRKFKPTDNIEDFKVMLKSYLGQTVKAVVKRDGKIQTIMLKIPNTL